MRPGQNKEGRERQEMRSDRQWDGIVRLCRSRSLLWILFQMRQETTGRRFEQSDLHRPMMLEDYSGSGLRVDRAGQRGSSEDAFAISGKRCCQETAFLGGLDVGSERRNGVRMISRCGVEQEEWRTAF